MAKIISKPSVTEFALTFKGRNDVFYRRLRALGAKIENRPGRNGYNIVDPKNGNRIAFRIDGAHWFTYPLEAGEDTED